VKQKSELRLCCPAQARYVSLIRHALGAFLDALQCDRTLREDATTAAGEALANVVEHAYARGCLSVTCDLQLFARFESDGRLSIEVSDNGSFIRRKPALDRGFGLRIIRAVARKTIIDTSRGTCVIMTFGPASPKR